MTRLKTLFLTSFMLLSAMATFAQIPERVMNTEVSRIFEIEDLTVLRTQIQKVNEKFSTEKINVSKHNLLSENGKVTDWNSYFDNVYLSHFGVSEYCFSNLKAFLNSQEPDGFINGTFNDDSKKEHFKPFLAQIAFIGSKQTRDFSWLDEVHNGKTYYQRLKDYISYWFTQMDENKNGFPAWENESHSGILSNSKNKNTKIEGVDLANYLYRELQTMAILALKKNELKEQQEFIKRANSFLKKIDAHFWNETDSCYYNKNEKKQDFITENTTVGLLSLFGGSATRAHAKRYVQKHYSLENTKSIAVNYMVFHGLLDYGFTELAEKLVKKMYTETKTTKIEKQTSALPLLMTYEYAINYNPTSLYWQPIVPVANEYLNLEFDLQSANE